MTIQQIKADENDTIADVDHYDIRSVETATANRALKQDEEARLALKRALEEDDYKRLRDARWRG